MIDYMVAQRDISKERGRFLIEYKGKRSNSTVTAYGSPSPSWIDVQWESDIKAITEPIGAGDALQRA
jgi:hypothetical protein